MKAGKAISLGLVLLLASALALGNSQERKRPPTFKVGVETVFTASPSPIP